MTLSTMLTVTASTKRATISGGKRAAPTTNISSLTITPLDPLDADISTRDNTDTPYELLHCFCTGDLDIEEGDILTVSSVDYPIRAVSKWKWGSTYYLELVVEELKQ